MFFGQIGKSLAVAIVCGIDEWDSIGAGLYSCRHRIDFITHQDEPGIGFGLYLLDQGFKLARISGFVLHGDQLRTQCQAHSFIFQILEPLEPGVDLSLRHGIAHQDGKTGFIDKGLFVPEQNRLAADLHHILTRTDCKGSNGRSRGFGKHCLRVL